MGRFARWQKLRGTDTVAVVSVRPGGNRRMAQRVCRADPQSTSSLDCSVKFFSWRIFSYCHPDKRSGRVCAPFSEPLIAYGRRSPGRPEVTERAKSVFTDQVRAEPHAADST